MFVVYVILCILIINKSSVPFFDNKQKLSIGFRKKLCIATTHFNLSISESFLMIFSFSARPYQSQ